MTSTHMTTPVEQAVAMLLPLPRHQQSQVIAQMVFDGALTAAQGKDVLFELSVAELFVAPVQPEPSMWKHALQFVSTHNDHGVRR